MNNQNEKHNNTLVTSAGYTMECTKQHSCDDIVTKYYTHQQLIRKA